MSRAQTLHLGTSRGMDSSSQVELVLAQRLRWETSSSSQAWSSLATTTWTSSMVTTLERASSWWLDHHCSWIGLIMAWRSMCMFLTLSLESSSNARTESMQSTRKFCTQSLLLGSTVMMICTSSVTTTMWSLSLTRSMSSTQSLSSQASSKCTSSDHCRSSTWSLLQQIFL